MKPHETTIFRRDLPPLESQVPTKRSSAAKVAPAPSSPTSSLAKATPAAAALAALASATSLMEGAYDCNVSLNQLL